MDTQRRSVAPGQRGEKKREGWTEDLSNWWTDDKKERKIIYFGQAGMGRKTPQRKGSPTCQGTAKQCRKRSLKPQERGTRHSGHVKHGF